MSLLSFFNPCRSQILYAKRRKRRLAKQAKRLAERQDELINYLNQKSSSDGEQSVYADARSAILDEELHHIHNAVGENCEQIWDADSVKLDLLTEQVHASRKRLEHKLTIVRVIYGC